MLLKKKWPWIALVGSLLVLLLVWQVYQRHRLSESRLKSVVIQVGSYQKDFSAINGFTQSKTQAVKTACPEDGLGTTLAREYTCIAETTVTYISKASASPKNITQTLQSVLQKIHSTPSYASDDVASLPGVIQSGVWQGRYYISPSGTLNSTGGNTEIFITAMAPHAISNYNLSDWGTSDVGNHLRFFSGTDISNKLSVAIDITQVYDSCKVNSLPCGVILAH